MSANPKDKVVGIELLRFLSAFAVLMWHYQHFGLVTDDMSFERSAQPFYHWLYPFYEHGRNGVRVFWCISGFIFFLTYYRSISERRTDFRTFAVNRFSRLYPLHVVSLIAVAVLQFLFLKQYDHFFIYEHNDAKHFLLNLVFASHWGFQEGQSFNAPFWSVSVEVVIYAIFFLFVANFTSVTGYLLSMVLFFLLFMTDEMDFALCIMYFYIGGCFAIAKYFPERLSGNPLFGRFAFPLVGLSLAVSLLVVYGLGRCCGDITSLPFIREILVVSSLVYAFIVCERLFLQLSGLWAFLGNLTYASYLVHFPLQLLIVVLFPVLGWQIDYQSPYLFGLFFLSTFLLSAVVYQMLERPAQRYIRRRWLGREASSRSPVAAKVAGQQAE